MTPLLASKPTPATPEMLRHQYVMADILSDCQLSSESRETGELALWRAVLSDALNAIIVNRPTITYPQGGRSHQQNEIRNTALVAEDVEWLKSDSDHAGSFLWACEHLKLDPKKIRERTFAARGDSSNGTTQRLRRAQPRGRSNLIA